MRPIQSNAQLKLVHLRQLTTLRRTGGFKNNHTQNSRIANNKNISPIPCLFTHNSIEQIINVSLSAEPPQCIIIILIFSVKALANKYRGLLINERYRGTVQAKVTSAEKKCGKQPKHLKSIKAGELQGRYSWTLS